MFTPLFAPGPHPGTLQYPAENTWSRGVTKAMLALEETISPKPTVDTPAEVRFAVTAPPELSRLYEGTDCPKNPPVSVASPPRRGVAGFPPTRTSVKRLKVNCESA